MMQGRRIDADLNDPTLFPFPRLEPGDYGNGVDGMWYYRAPCPHGGFFMGGNLSAHKVTEHEDGTITVSPSILIKHHKGTWHGYLERDVWREC